MPKFNIRRKCGCSDKVKIYPGTPDKKHAVILFAEQQKNCSFHQKEVPSKG